MTEMKKKRKAPGLACLLALAALVGVSQVVMLQPSAARGADEPGETRYRYRAVAFGKADEREATRRLNELEAEGWEYVGPLANGLVAFRKPLLTRAEKAAR